MIKIDPIKLKEDQDSDVSDAAKSRLTQLRHDISVDTMAFLATLPCAPQSIKNAAILATAENAKIK